MRLTRYGTQLPNPEPDPVGEAMLRFLAGEPVDVTAEVLDRLRTECNAQEQYRIARDQELEALAARYAVKAQQVVGALEMPYQGGAPSEEASAGYRAGYSAGLYRGYSEAAVDTKGVLEAARRAIDAG